MSFSDMMSSGRGPGVIGMVMALVVLLGFGLLFMFAFDEGFQGGELSDEAVILQQGKEIENYQGSIERGQKSVDKGPKLASDIKDLKALNIENQTTQQNIVTLSEKVKAAEASLVDLGKVFEGYKDEYRTYVRDKAKGTIIKELVTVNGEVYKEARIGSVSAIGMDIVHQEGHKRIAFEELPEAMKDYYQFDPKQKENEIAVETKTRADHDKLTGEAEKLAEAAAAKLKQEDAAKAKLRAQREISEKQTQLATYKKRAKELQHSIDQEERKRSGLKKTSIYKQQLASVQGSISGLESEVIKLKSSF